MADTTRTIGDVLADLNSIRKGKMPDGSTAADRAKKKKKAPLMGDLDSTEVQHKPDVNLPDESAGKPVGQLRFPEKSKDSIKQEYRDRLEKRMRREKGPMTDGDIQQEEQSRIIFGGDEDDPRVAEHRERKRTIGKRSYKAATLGGLSGGE